MRLCDELGCMGFVLRNCERARLIVFSEQPVFKRLSERRFEGRCRRLQCQFEPGIQAYPFTRVFGLWWRAFCVSPEYPEIDRCLFEIKIV
ncbi:hypothetical protein D3C84_730880 [compost metagenome]